MEIGSCLNRILGRRRNLDAYALLKNPSAEFLSRRIHMRIHIGQISPALAEHVGELESRLSRFAPLPGPLELRRKPHGDMYFTFVDMPLDASGYGQLRKSLNGVTFRQSKLSIDKAVRPPYVKPVPQEMDARGSLNPEQIKRQNSARAHLDGRHRTTPRPEKQLKGATFRIWLNGRIRKPRSRKVKLWGVDRRPLERLVRGFEDGVWRDSEGRTIEVPGADEFERNQMLVESLPQDTYLSDSDFEAYKEDRTELAEQSSDSELELVPRNASTVVQKPDVDSDSDMDMEYEQYGDAGHKDSMLNPSGNGTETNKRTDNSLSKDPDSQSNLAQGSHTTASDHQQNLPQTEQTEALRSVLAVETPFTLFGGTPEPEPEISRPTAAPVVAPEPRKFGLFFTHSESPFLRSLSQASKLTGDFDSLKWQAEFWEHRGEWNRALRRRRRDVAKKQRKQRG